MEAHSGDAALSDIPIHVLGKYECADGGVINPVGVLDSSLDAEVVEGHGVTGQSLAQEAADAVNDTAAGADSNMPQLSSPTAINSTTDGYSPPPFSFLSCCSSLLRVVRGELHVFIISVMNTIQYDRRV